MSIRVEPLTGTDFARALPALAQLRIEVFRDWPYLYDGSLAYEERYVAKFAAAEMTVIVAAFDGTEIVGCATASPLRGHADQFATAFEATGLDPQTLFYFGESVLRTSYRGRGIGHAFFDHREAYAKSLGGFAHTTFCGVVRPQDHPMRPTDYRPLDGFWTRRGYAKLDGVTAQFGWKDVGELDETKKLMQFWIKSLGRPLS
jgi:GNAT superfamily N-acetyltransferase